MKKLSLLAVLSIFFFPAFTQFQGSLTYEQNATNKIVTTYYQNSTMGRIDAKIYPLLKNKVPDTANAKDQDPLIFDFNANREITLHSNMKMAITTLPNTFFFEKQMQMTSSDVTVKLVGSEKVGNYSCQHFHVMVKKSMKDLNIWITQDLGNANIIICPMFLYYTPGCIGTQMIQSAGGTGVVVKATSGPLTINLVSYTKRTPPTSLFQTPSGYQSVDHSGQ
jgi:hypothetical protein